MTAARSSGEDLRDEILGSGVLLAGTVDGLYGRSGRYEDVATGLDALFTRLGAGEVEDHVRFPPIVARSAFERTGYLSSFPNLMGSVHSFSGDDRRQAAMMDVVKAGGPWAASLEPTEVMLCSAACHSLYPALTGTLPAGGRRLQVSSWCFRHEPSRSLTRMQAFRMAEFVYVGEPPAAVEFRDRWIVRGRDALVDLGLEVDTVPANDPFFGRRGRFFAQSQREDELKFEIVTSFDASESPVALASSNLHQDHFGLTFGIATADGQVAHSTCFGWGIDRVVLALFHLHGSDPATWPDAVRSRLWP